MDLELNVALIQTPLAWENPEKNRVSIEAKIAGLKSTTDLVLLPEMFTTGFTMNASSILLEESKKTISWLQKVAASNTVAIVGSMVFSEEQKFYNRLFFVCPDGQFWYYNKRHTFSLAGEDQVYTSGNKKLIVTYKGFYICPQICYDLRFPVWARNTEDYDVLLYVANWPKQRIGAWDTLLKARAIENMAYCIGVNRTGMDPNGFEYPGHSAIYDCLGKTIKFSNKEEILYASLSKKHIKDTRNTFDFLKDRDAFILKL